MNNREHVIVAQQDEIEVYAGDTGFIIIKQSHELEEADLIFIAPIHAEAIAKAVLAAKENAEQFRKEWIAEGDHEPS